MSLTKEQKDAFDRINKYSYLFRLQMERMGIGIAIKVINGCEAYYILYRNHVIGVVSFGDQYVNFNLYSYIRKLFPKLDDFRMVDYFDADMTHFLFDKFDECIGSIKDALDTLPASASIEDDAEVKESIDDVRARLLEFMVSDDIGETFFDSDSLPLNILRHDIAMVLREINRLEVERNRKSESLVRMFLSI